MRYWGSQAEKAEGPEWELYPLGSSRLPGSVLQAGAKAMDLASGLWDALGGYDATAPVYLELGRTTTFINNKYYYICFNYKELKGSL